MRVVTVAVPLADCAVLFVDEMLGALPLRGVPSGILCFFFCVELLADPFLILRAGWPIRRRGGLCRLVVSCSSVNLSNVWTTGVRVRGTSLQAGCLLGVVGPHRVLRNEPSVLTNPSPLSSSEGPTPRLPII